MATVSSQQQRQHDSAALQEEYLSAQRAAVEAVMVGRETLEVVSQQGEQLNRAQAYADETQLQLERAGRMLRGMTWSGWVANMFTRDTTTTRAPPSMQEIEEHEPPTVYPDNLPTACRGSAQAVQNYHANVKVLEACETDEQKETCQLICDTMFDVAVKELRQIETSRALEGHTIQFAKDLAVLRKRQKASQERIRQFGAATTPTFSKHATERDELTSVASTVSTTTTRTPSPQDARLQQQNEHLDVISQSLGELGSIAQNLGQSMDQQADTINSLDAVSENILETSKMVTRRADRLVQKRSWTPVRPTFHDHVSIRHIATGKYLAVLGKDLYLVPRYHPSTCVFGLWKRQGQIFGLQSKHSSKWVGQSLFGSLSCSASSFGRREEWDAGDEREWSSTRLLCASAGWGAGGYLHVSGKDWAVAIGGMGVEERNKADLWCLEFKSAASTEEVSPRTIRPPPPHAFQHT